MTRKIKDKQAVSHPAEKAAPKRRGRPPRDPNAPRLATAPAPKQGAPKSNALETLEIASFTIKEFRARNHISDGAWSNLCKAGLAPRMMRPTGVAHGMVRISREAERDWQRDCEKRTVPEEAKTADREKRAEIKARKAGGAS